MPRTIVTAGLVSFLIAAAAAAGAAGEREPGAKGSGEKKGEPRPDGAAEPKGKKQAQEEKGWVRLFNGKDLEGWTVKIAGRELGDNFADTFRVEDGVLKVSYDGYDKFENRFGHIFHDGIFESYKLRVEYRFTGEQVAGGPGWAYRNSGIMIHGQTPESMTREQDFPVSVEVQLLGGRSRGERSTANLCTPGTNVVMDGKLVTRHCIDSSSKTYRGDRWVTAVVEVRGNRVKHIVEGETVLAYTDPQLDEKDPHARKLLEGGAEKLLRRGTISLQSESHPVEFRKVEILELESPAVGAAVQGPATRSPSPGSTASGSSS